MFCVQLIKLSSIREAISNLFDDVLALIFVLALQLAQTCWMTVAGDTVLGLPVSVLCKLRVLCCVLLAKPTKVCVQAKTG